MWQKLDGGGASAEEVGGKAAALDGLVAAGVPVPPATVITVEAYRAFVEAAGLQAFLAQLPTTVAPAEIEDDAARVDEAFRDAAFPEPVEEAIWEAFEHGARGRSVAVRSSATTEDLAEASFAGQHRSFLGIGVDDLEDSVRYCWASLWAPGVRAYRHARGVDREPAMGVVIQQMVPAERSGVIFTVDPTGEQPGTMRVEIVEGLGEHLVSGRITPEVRHLRRDASSLREGPGAPWLRELGRMAMAIEETFGQPQDIEWSAAAGRLYILQSRPVTTVGPGLDDGFDTPITGTTRFTAEGVGEMLPGVVPPLLWTINAALLEDGFTALFRDLGVEAGRDDRAETPGPMVARFRGRPALNLSRLQAAAWRMPRGSAAEVEQQYLGRVVSEDGAGGAPGLRDRLRRVLPAWRAIRLRRRLVRDAEVFTRAAELAVALEPDYESTPTASLVAYRRRLRDVARVGVRTELAASAAAAAHYRALELNLARWLGPDEASLVAQRVTSDLDERGNDREGAFDPWGLQRERDQLPAAVIEVLDAGPIDGVEERLAASGPEGRAFLARVRDRLRRSASAAVYGGRTWDEERDSVWLALRAQSSSRTAGTDGAVDDGDRPAWRELEARLTRTRRWRITRVLTGQLVDVRRRLLRRTVDDATRYLRLREEVKAAVLLLGGEERRVVGEIAERLRTEGTFEPGDEWFVSDTELDGFAAGRHPVSAATLAHRRDVFTAFRDAPPLPAVFSGAPTASSDGEEGSALRGWATAPGRAEGRVRVVRDLADGRDLERGEVLVGRSSDPSWTPLFLGAAAVVMEQGGPLSHAAIVARELGLPAVLNVTGATRRLTTGTKVVVDGATGSVEIVEDARHDAGGTTPGESRSPRESSARGESRSPGDSRESDDSWEPGESRAPGESGAPSEAREEERP